MQREKKTIVFTGGGTGGHIIPGVVIAKALKEQLKNLDIVWIGSLSDFESGLIPDDIVRIRKIPTGKLRRYFSLKNIIDVFKIFAGVVISFFILLKEKPSLIFSKGGYVSVPPVVAAFILKIPIFTHESDIDPGLATRINSLFAERIFVSFNETVGYFGEKFKNHIYVTGNPVRREILKGNALLGRKKLRCDPDNDVILILGGSQGARGINRLVYDIVDELIRRNCCVVHQTGHQQGEGNYLTAATDREVSHYCRFDFIREDLPDFLAAATVVISRAGAGTIWELAATGKPAILIPLPTSGSRGDQIRNARLLEKLKAAIVFREEELTRDVLLETIFKLLDNKEQLNSLGNNIKKIYREDSAKIISNEIINRIYGGRDA